MISVSAAKEIISQSIHPLPSKYFPIQNTLGCVLAEDVYALYDAPAFRQSSMDGYAFLYDDFINHREIKIIDAVAAGDDRFLVISAGMAARIFTGAPLPDGADTVVMQEKVKVNNDILTIEDHQINKGSNVREKGAELKKGSLVMEKGKEIKSRTIGFLAGLGIAAIKVYPAPSVALIITGNELQPPGTELGYGKVFESNSFTLVSVLKSLGIENVSIYYAPDNIVDVTTKIGKALIDADILLLTGGVSVGDYDFVVQATANNGVKQLFHKIAQKPGKPIFLGMKEDKVIVGLPGNPGSVLTCFYEYVELAISKLMNKQSAILSKNAWLNQDYKINRSLTHFLKGHLIGERVEILDAQESFRLKSFVEANCLIVLPQGRDQYYTGDEVEVHVLP
jgi:molybdopterin molybdotransferase